MQNIIQLGMDRNDDFAFTLHQGKYIKVPIWVWAEWELPEGIAGIINEWQKGLLITYDSGSADNFMGFRGFLDVEADALKSIQKQAVMLKRYFSGKRIEGLTREERMVLDLERQCMIESPHFKGEFKQDWIAQKMTRRTGSAYTVSHIKAILSDITYVMNAYYDLVLQEKMLATLKVLSRVWQEEAAVIVAAA